ncbi:transcription factor TGA9-like protein isoform X1 [Tanacetum coccineum]
MMPITSAEDKAQGILERKARSTLMMGIPNEHQLKFNSIKDAKLLLEAIEKRFGGNEATKKTQRNLLKYQYENFTALSSEMLDQTFDRLQKLMSQLELLGEKLSQEDVNQKLLRSLSPKWNTHAIVWRNKANMKTMSMDDLYNKLKVYEPEVKGMSSSSSSTQNMAFVSSSNNNSGNNDIKEMDLRWQMAMLTMRARRFLMNTGRRLIVNRNENIGFDMSKVECYNCHKKGHFSRECRALRNQDYKNKENEGPNYALMAYSSSSSDSEVSNESNCSKSCMEIIKLLKTQNDQLLRGLEKSSLMVLGYKTGEITIGDLRKKLEKLQKDNDSIQFNVDKLENGSKSLDKLIECQIVDNYEFVNKPIVENRKSNEEVSKIVRKNDDAPIIEE